MALSVFPKSVHLIQSPQELSTTCWPHWASRLTTGASHLQGLERRLSRFLARVVDKGAEPPGKSADGVNRPKPAGKGELAPQCYQSRLGDKSPLLPSTPPHLTELPPIPTQQEAQPRKAVLTAGRGAAEPPG